MKVKFGDLTGTQMKEICEKSKCCSCFLSTKTERYNVKECMVIHPPCFFDLEIEIDLPDKETNDEG